MQNISQHFLAASPLISAVLAGAAAVMLTWWSHRRATYPKDRLGLEYDPAARASTGGQKSLPGRRWASLSTLLMANPTTIRRFQELAGQPVNPAALRLRQITCAIVFSLGVIAIATLTMAFARLHLVQLLIALGAGALSGFMLPTYHLQFAAKKRQTQLQRELPDVIELLALCVGAGENLHSAIQRLAERCQLVSGEVFGKAVIRLGMGLSLPEVLQAMSRENDAPLLKSLVGALLTALERGTPLAAVLRDQAADSRSLQRAQLLELGGSKEIWMMVPVVFLILPLTVVFALYPGLAALHF